MKILKEGKIPTFAGVCGFCGCQIECDRSDGCMSFTEPQIFATLMVTCPTCHNIIRAIPQYEAPPSKYRNE